MSTTIWETKRLPEVADMCLGKMLDQKKNKGEYYPYLANLNVRWGAIELENLREMRFERKEFERYGLKYGDIVMCEGGEPGRCAFWKKQAPSMLIQKALHRIRAKDKVDSLFLFYSLLNKGLQGQYDGYFTGAAIKHLTGEKLAKVEIELPQYSTQKKISAVLETYDDLIENNLKRIKLLEEMAQITYEEWFVHMKFPDYDIAVFDEETGLPEGWGKRKIEDIAEFSNGYAFYTKGYSETGFDVIDLGNISKSSDLAITGQEKKVSEELYKASSKFHLFKNDVVIAMTDITKELGILAKSGIIDKDNTYVLNQRVGRLRSKVDYIDYSYIYALINDKRFIGTMHSMSKGAVQFYFNTKDIINYEVVIPAQNTIEAFQKKYKPFLEARQTLKEQISFLKEARGILLPRLMTGMIDIEQVELPEAMLKRLEQQVHELVEG
jgi:type I restriction enzyme S subunit